MTRVEHHSERILAVMVGAMIAFSLASPFIPMLHFVGTMICLLMVAALIGVGVLSHSIDMCHICLLNTPVNTSVAAEEYNTSFSVFHKLNDKYIFFAAYLVLVIFGQGLLLWHLWGVIPWIALMVSVPYVIRVHSVHRFYKPWCPKCKRGGTGMVAKKKDLVLV